MPRRTERGLVATFLAFATAAALRSVHALADQGQGLALPRAQVAETLSDRGEIEHVNRHHVQGAPLRGVPGRDARSGQYHHVRYDR
jgi:hypothetical protein